MSHYALGTVAKNSWKGEREIHHNRKTLWLLFTLPAISFAVACFAFSTPVHAAQSVPYKINFQGRLTNASGIALTGTHEMQIKLYTAVTGGTYVWGETRTTANGNAVTVTNGIFSLLIGEGTAVAGSSASLQAAVTTNMTLFAEVTVGAETLTPRNQLGASAYAFNSDTIDGIDGASLAQLSTANSFTNTNLITTSNASAFVVNSGSSNLFKVDTTGTGQVAVGTSDANGTILVLDTKSDNATDPTGAAGAMYYNSTVGKFRCYQVSAWVDCITPAGGATLQTAYDGAGTPATITTSSAAKTLLFKAGSGYDAAALFDIQDAAGTSLFMVDSTNDRVYVGDNTADGTGAIMVLDTKNTAGDPTGVDGAMYYNSDEKSFHCYGNGLWRDCDFASLRSEWVVQEEFANISTTTLSTGSQGWTGASVGTGGTAAKTNVGTSSTNYDRFGVLQLSSAATTINTGWNIRLDITGMTGVPSNMTTEFDFAPVSANAAAATNQTTFIGLHNGTNNTTAPTDGMYFRYTATTTAGNWDRCVQASCVSTGVARTTNAGEYQRFKIQTNSAGTSIEFFINEASVGTVSSGLPTQAAADVYGPSIRSVASGSAPTVVMQWKMDYFQVKRNLTTLR